MGSFPHISHQNSSKPVQRGVLRKSISKINSSEE